MDNSGLVTLNFGMNVANSQGSATSQILHQLPGFQQVFTQNTQLKSADGTQNVVQQTVLPVNNTPQTGNPTVLAAATGLQFVGQPGPGFLGPQQQQPQLLTQQTATPQILGPRSMYATNYQIMPRNFTVFNQGIQGPTGVAVQLSPQQIGGTTLSPMEQQQQFFQSAGFDPQLGTLQQQNQQQITFQNGNCQFMIQSPSQQLMLQSPNQQFALPSPSQQFTVQNQNQFAVQGHNLTQFNPQHHILTQGQGNNVIVQNQTGGMILQSDNFVSQGLSQNVFVPNPSIVQNVNPQVYGTAQNVLTNQIPGLISQTQVVANQNVGIISVSHSLPAPNGSADNLGKANIHNSGITNEQMQLLAHIANHGTDVNNTNLPNQQNLVQQVTSQNQSLPSFGHFLLHHHMQSLPHPFLQNLSISTMATDDGTRKQIAQPGMTVSPPSNQSGVITMNISSNSGPISFRNSTDNINAEFNNWNISQFVNQSCVNQNSIVASNVNTQLSKGADVKLSVQTLCSSKVSNSVHISQVVSTTTNVLSKGITQSKLCTSEELSAVRSVSIGIDSTTPSRGQQEKTPQTAISTTHTTSSRNTIVVPYGWVRALEGDSIVYYSPTCTRLTSTDSVKQYLITDGTCKCGLECPLHVDRVFNFNSDVISIKWNPSFSNIKDAGNPCNHKRKYSSISSSQSVRSFGMTRPDVSMVTSSGLMSPRVSSTVQETQALIDGNKRRKIVRDENLLSSTSANSSTIDLTNTIKEIPESSLNNDDVVISCDSVKKSDKTTTDLSVTDDVVSTSMISSNNNNSEPDLSDKTESVTLNKAKNKIDMQNVEHSEKPGSGRVFLKDISRSIPKQLILPEVSFSKTCDTITCSNKKIDVICSRLSGGVNVADSNKADSISALKSPVLAKTDGRLLSPKSSSRSSSRSSVHSKHPADALSPRSERNVLTSKSMDRPQSSGNDQRFTAEMFTHFMNFCGLTSSNIPPVLQQNIVGIPGSDSLGKDALQTGFPLVNDAIKSDLMKLPMMPQSPFGPLQANILANLHKLTSPPNQQVFPALNLSGLSSKHPGAFHHDSKTSALGSSHTISVRSGSLGPLPVSLSVSTAGLGSPNLSDIILLSPSKKTRMKKSSDQKVESSKNIESIFDSDEPPPNVDVSQLKDKGHGPIPKEKIASFIEDSSEFSKQSSDLMSKSISSTTSSPVNDCGMSKESCPVDSQSEKTRSDSACSDRLNSPCPMDRETADISDDVTTVENLPAVNSVLTKDSNSFSTTSITNSGAKVSVSLAHQLTTGTSIVQSTPVASAPPTPTTVVHHTPGSLSCHQMSLIKARQHALGLKDGSKDLSTESLLHPLAAILSDPTIGQVFQQMFPEVAQQVLMHSFDVHKSNASDMSVDMAAGMKTKKPAMTPVIPGHCPVSTTTPVSAVMSAQYQKPNFPIQPVISNMSQGEFPASTLLSAAAKAQLEYQQSQFGALMAQQFRGSLPGALLPPQIYSRNISSTVHNAINTSAMMPTVATGVNIPCVSVSKQGSIPVTCVTFTTLDSTMTSTASVSEKFKPRVGAQKISELLNRNKPNAHPDVEMTNLIQLLQKPERPNLHRTDISKLSHMLQATQVPVSSTCNQANAPINMNNNSLMAPLGNLIAQGQGQNVDMQAVNPHLMQMCNTLGIPINCELMTPKHVRSAGPTAESSIQRTSINQFVAPGAQSGPQFACNVSGSGASLPLLVQQSDLSNTGIVQNAQQFVPVLDAATGGNQVFNLQGIQAANVQGLLQPTHFSIPTLSLANEGVLTRQLNPNVAMPASLSDTSHNPVLISNNLSGNSTSTPDMINLLNMNHTIGSGTHLTAMQLQTLQLQQQLLQQLQQVQGMQNLISQYNLQNHSVTTGNCPGGLKKEAAITVPQGDACNNSVTPSTNRASPPGGNNVINTNPPVSSAHAATEDCNASEPDSKVTSEVSEEQTSLRKSCNVRVIAAADTTEDCSTKTVDIGTETDAFVEDNSESDLEEVVNSEGNSSSKSEEEMENDVQEISDNGEEKVDIHISTENQDDTKTLSPVVSSVSRKSSANTCLAIATQKGNSRSSEIESRVLGEKSSLARSQNLSAELAKPAGGELKLRIKRKHLLHADNLHDSQSGQVKRIKMKERKSQSYLIVKKALRSSTLAATKASSVAAKYMSRDKLKELVKRQVKTSSEVSGKASLTTASSSKMPNVLPTSSSESYECDSSIDSQTGSVTDTDDKDLSVKDSITSRIAAALSSQKGLWQLSNQKKASPADENSSCKATCSSLVAEAGRKRTRLDNAVEDRVNEGVQEKSAVVPCSFNTGDLVWGQIRGFPSWPGKLVENTELKTGETLEDGKVLVKWFGDNTITQVEPNKLKTLSEGLEAHHRARKKHRRGRKMNSNLEQAIQHAMTELDKQTPTADNDNKASSVSDIVVKSVKMKHKK